jgi:hypothetical protein
VGKEIAEHGRHQEGKHLRRDRPRVERPIARQQQAIETLRTHLAEIQARS